MIPALSFSGGRYQAVDGAVSHQIDQGSEEEEEEESLLVSQSLVPELASTASEASVARRPPVSTDHSPISFSKLHRRQNPTSALGSPLTSIHPPPPFDLQRASLRSVSREGSIPMNHPTPDLQAIQGAYVANVERLEQHAERLSMGSDMAEELRKLKLEQKRTESRHSSIRKPPSRQFSSNSHANSILDLNNVARSGGFSHEGYVMSPPTHSPIRSPSQSYMSPTERRRPSDPFITSNSVEEEPVQQSPTSYRSGRLSVRNEDPSALHTHEEEQEPQETEYDRLYDAAKDLVQRTASNASKTTYQQAEAAFADFDGTHIHESIPPPVEEAEEEGEEEEEKYEQERHALSPLPTQPTHREKSPRGPPPGLVYYPAPVPMMLNLPPKLSKGPSAAQIAQRRTRMLMDDNKARKSTANLLNSSIGADAEQDSEATGLEDPKLPPQLRATMFFDQNPVPQDIELQDGSAVATLDSILDASAFAPVSAFTDHPIVGQVGKEVYGAAGPGLRKSRSNMQLGQAQATTRKSFLGFGRKSRVMDDGGVPGDEEGSDEDEDDDAAENDDEFADPDNTRPTTLLAELQMRKKQQQMRNKTAATAFPTGMRATLLQLDAVAQVQRDARKGKHVILAWEEPTIADAAGLDDDDVPLAMLHKVKGQGHSPVNQPWDEDRPLGLIAQRHLEDNEPLSARRARLRGDVGPSAPNHPRNNLPPPPPPGAAEPEPEPDDEEDEEEAGETLAQRRRRLKIQDAIPVARPVSGDFASELMSELGVPSGDKRGPVNRNAQASSTTPEPEEETLGQRRKRLQAERLAESQGPKADRRTSMANLLAAYPTGQRQPSGESGSSGAAPARPYPLQHASTMPNRVPQRQSSAGTLAQMQDAYAQRQSTAAYAYGATAAPPVYPLQHQPVYAAQTPAFAYGQQMAYGHNQQAAALQSPWAYNAYLGANPAANAVVYPPPNMQVPVPMPLQYHMRSSTAALGGMQAPVAAPPDDARRAMVDRWRQSVV